MTSTTTAIHLDFKDTSASIISHMKIKYVVLVWHPGAIRDETERLDEAEMDMARLVGICYGRIMAKAQHILDDNIDCRETEQGISPYGESWRAKHFRKVPRMHFV